MIEVLATFEVTEVRSIIDFGQGLGEINLDNRVMWASQFGVAKVALAIENKHHLE